jgi:hypothetical protein
MATNGVSSTANGSFLDNQYQSTGQLSRDDGTTARNSWNDDQDEARQNGQSQHAGPQPINNRKSNDGTNRNLAGTNENINSNGNHCTNNNNQAQPQTQTDEEDAAAHQPWFRRVAEKYGTLELDNKGSVARDHLALGIFYPLYTMTGDSIANGHRTHIPRLAPNIPLICLDRHRSNPIIPSQQLRILSPITTNFYRLEYR